MEGKPRAGSPAPAAASAAPVAAPVARKPNPAHLANIKALRADMENWLASGRALMDRMVDLIHDAERR